MEAKKKKIFPKVKKKFENFLTDESGKITKKGALWISAGAALLSSFDSVDAATYHFNDSFNTSHSNTAASHSSHSSWCGGHSNAIPHSNITYGNFRDVVVDYDAGAGCVTSHASGIVNGHASVTPVSDSWDSDGINSITWHTSHVSHVNHGSWGWC